MNGLFDISPMSYRVWKEIYMDLNKQKKPEDSDSYQFLVTKQFGAEVWYEIAYGLPKLERVTVETAGLP